MSVDRRFALINQKFTQILVNSQGTLPTGTVAVSVTAAPTTTAVSITGNSGVAFTGSAPLGLTIKGATGTADYSGIDFQGIAGKPQARIAAYFSGAGSYLVFGTSNSHVSGITNAAVSIDYNGAVTIAAPTTAVNTLTITPAATHRALVLAAGATTSFNLEVQSGTGAAAAYFVSNQGAGTPAIRCDNTTVALTSNAATLGLTRSGGGAAQVGWMVINLDGAIRYIPYWG